MLLCEDVWGCVSLCEFVRMCGDVNHCVSLCGCIIVWFVRVCVIV